MSESNYKPSGKLQGDSKALPNRGTGTGFVGISGGYGADTGVNATNRMGSAHTPSDPMDQCCPPGGGDHRAGGHTSPRHGRGMGGVANSDPMDDTTPGDEGMRGDRD